MENEFERILFFEHARKSSEAAYAKDPRDVDNLTRWGSALLELASFQQTDDAKEMLRDAVSKFEEALEVNPKKPETLWCLGNAMTALGFLFPDASEAGSYFKKAGDYFTKACEEDPSNSLFQKSLEMAAKAPEIHAEFNKHGLGQQVAATTTAGPSASSSTRTSKTTTKKTNNNNDLKYDVLGWCILAVGIVVWLGFTKNQPPPPPQPR